MNNPLRILQAVDARLDHRVELVLYGRAALALGFGDPPPAALATSDVDGILPADRLAALRADANWCGRRSKGPTRSWRRRAST